MSTRIPPSLNWLIDKHARVSGKIEMTQKLILKKVKATQELTSAQSILAVRLAACLSDLNNLKTELADFQKDLSGIDRTMQLHDIQVDLVLIKAITPCEARIRLPYGELTSSLLSFLRKNKGEPLSTDELTFMLVKKFSHLGGTSDQDLKETREKVRYRLKKLAEEESIIRVPFPDTKTRKPTRWSLPTAIPRP